MITLGPVSLWKTDKFNPASTSSRVAFKAKKDDSFEKMMQKADEELQKNQEWKEELDDFKKKLTPNYLGNLPKSDNSADKASIRIDSRIFANRIEKMGSFDVDMKFSKIIYELKTAVKDNNWSDKNRRDFYVLANNLDSDKLNAQKRINIAWELLELTPMLPKDEILDAVEYAMERMQKGHGLSEDRTVNRAIKATKSIIEKFPEELRARAQEIIDKRVENMGEIDTIYALDNEYTDKDAKQYYARKIFGIPPEQFIPEYIKDLKDLEEYTRKEKRSWSTTQGETFFKLLKNLKFVKNPEFPDAKPLEIVDGNTICKLFLDSMIFIGDDERYPVLKLLAGEITGVKQSEQATFPDEYNSFRDVMKTAYSVSEEFSEKEKTKARKLLDDKLIDLGYDPEKFKQKLDNT